MNTFVTTSLLLLLAPTCCQARPAEGALRGLSASAPTVEELRAQLMPILKSEESGGSSSEETSPELARQLFNIEASLASTFQSLPKNSHGRVASASVHYLVHSYFAKEHGWRIKGLEATNMSMELISDNGTHVFQEVPAVMEELLRLRHSDTFGLTFADVTAMVALLERLISNQSMDLLKVAFEYRSLELGQTLTQVELHDVLTSYLILLRRPLLERWEHLDWAHHSRRYFESADAQTLDDFVVKAYGFSQDNIGNFVYEQISQSSPFTDERHFSFEEASSLSDRLLNQYGRFQNEECSEMKASLMSLSTSESGYVHLRDFYRSQDDFTESVAYLSDIGALDNSSSRPRVRIANYMLGPSNCISSSQYYAICCLDECKPLMAEIEGLVRAPVATPTRLLRILGNLSSSSMSGPGELSKDLVGKLNAIADHHDGQVPIHGRLFAQWMHFAFPNECPYPQFHAKSQVEQWGDDHYHASKEEIEEHIQSEMVDVVASSPMAYWTDEEVLPLMEGRPSKLKLDPDSFASTLGRGLAFLGVASVVLRFAYSAISDALRASRSSGSTVPRGSAREKVDVAMLPF
mmetsp:Transcript_97911/g.204209  ORF Transcript_97911/g.204209 Transcript_97911/m.204209 type:complete len:578 (-) Transcript_97911:205-1938(-)